MPLGHRERLVDDLDQDWIFETVLRDGLAEVYVTAPGMERRRLYQPRLNRSVSRPSVDVEVPLPLDLT